MEYVYKYFLGTQRNFLWKSKQRFNFSILNLFFLTVTFLFRNFCGFRNSTYMYLRRELKEEFKTNWFLNQSTRNIVILQCSEFLSNNIKFRISIAALLYFLSWVTSSHISSLKINISEYLKYFHLYHKFIMNVLGKWLHTMYLLYYYNIIF